MLVQRTAATAAAAKHKQAIKGGHFTVKYNKMLKGCE